MKDFLITLLWDNSLVKYLIYPILVGYILLTLAIIFFSNRLLFPAHSNGSSYQDTDEILKLQTADGGKISAKYFLNEEAQYAILYSHGSGEDIGQIDEITSKLLEMGFAVFVYDYHGYGTSQGEATEKNTYNDVFAAYSYMRNELQIPAGRIILYGFALGSAPSVDLAARKPVGGLILESTFTSANAVFLDLPYAPFDKFKNIEKIKAVRCPVLVMHGRRDRIIPFKEGEMLFQAAPEPKLSLWVEDAEHYEVRKVAGEEYDRTVAQFMGMVSSTPTK